MFIGTINRTPKNHKMKIQLEKREMLKTLVRDIIAQDPLISIRKAQKVIEGREYAIGNKYLSRLMTEVRQEVRGYSDNKEIGDRLTEVRERFRLLIKQLNRIVYWDFDIARTYNIPEPTVAEKYRAIKLIGQLELSLLRTEFALGLFGNKKVTKVELSKSQTTTLKVGLE